MSKQILNALVDSLERAHSVDEDTRASTKVQGRRKIREINNRLKTWGNLYRAGSEEAVHVLYLYENTIAGEFKKLIEHSNLLKLQFNNGILSTSGKKQAAILNPETCRRLASIYKSAILKEISKQEGITVDPSGNIVTVRTNKNNYDTVYKALNMALAGFNMQGATGYKSVIDLVVKTLFELELKELATEINSLGSSDRAAAFASIDELTKGLKGFDVGHKEEASNIVNTVGAVLFDKIVRVQSASMDPRRSTRYTFKDKEAAETLKKIEKELLDFVNDPNSKDAFLSELKNVYGVNSEKLYRSLIHCTVGYARKMAEGKIHTVMKVEEELNRENIKKVASHVTNYVFPQFAAENQLFGATIEKSIAEHLLNATKENSEKNFRNFLNKWLKSGEGSNPNAATGFSQPIEMLGGSPSINDMVRDSIMESLKTGKSTSKQYDTNVSAKQTPVPAAKNPVKQTTTNTSVRVPSPKKVPIPKPITIKNRKGQFTSAVNVVNIINSQLADTIQKNMGSPRLNYRTGRFANSVAVKQPALMDKDDYLRLSYSYMKYPYQTFEVGFAQGSPARDPRTLISESIREIASRLVLTKLRVVRL